jgi:phosphoglycerate dehydrogenase-like enzyme
VHASLLISRELVDRHAAELEAVLAGAPRHLELLPFEVGATYTPAQMGSIEAAFYSRDIWEGRAEKHGSPEARAFWSVVDGAPALRWLQLVSVGLDHPCYQPSLRRGIRITTAAGTNAEPVALNALTGLLMLSRGFPHWIAAQQRRAWAPLQAADLPRELRGQTALVVGTGQIGARIAAALQALGVHTVGLRRTPRVTPGFDEVHALDTVDAQLPRADWLVLACPLGPQTRGLVDARRLALLPRGAGLVNIARGEIVDEPALVSALQSGRLLGAYLDVFWREPLPPDSPLWTLPNAILTPHNASASSGTRQRGFELFLRNLRAWLHGEVLESEVAPAR